MDEISRARRIFRARCSILLPSIRRQRCCCSTRVWRSWPFSSIVANICFFFLWMSEKQQKLKRRERSLFLFLDKYERRQRERRQFTFAVCVACDFVFFFFLSGVFHMCRNEFSVEIVFVSLSLIFALIWHDYCLIRRSTRYDFCRALSIFVTKRNDWQTRKCTSFSISATRKSTLLKSKQSDYDDENQTEWYPFIYYCYSFKRVPSDKDSNVFFGFRFRKIFSCFSHRDLPHDNSKMGNYFYRKSTPIKSNYRLWDRNNISEVKQNLSSLTLSTDKSNYSKWRKSKNESIRERTHAEKEYNFSDFLFSFNFGILFYFWIFG